MPATPELVAFVLELLAPVGPVRAQRMFGGHGLYARGVMFGLLDGDELFLKTDEASRPAFEAAGCRRWSFASGKVRMENTSYFRPPDEAHEDPEAMLPWARLALEAALRQRARRPARRGGREGAVRGAGARGPPAGRKARPRPPRAR